MQSLRGCSSLEMLDRTYHLEVSNHHNHENLPPVTLFLQHYTNIKDLDPDWDDDDIDVCGSLIYILTTILISPFRKSSLCLQSQEGG